MRVSTVTGYSNVNYGTIASGKRINSAADDASGLTQVQKLEHQSNGIAAGAENAKSGISLANVADSIAAVRDSISTKAVSPEDGSLDGSNLKPRRPALETNMEKVVIQQVDSSRRRIPAAPRRRVSE